MKMTQKPRIVMVCYIFPPNFGGAIVQALRLGKALQLMEYRVSFLADNGKNGDITEQYESFDLYRRATFSDDNGSYVRQLAWAARILMFAIRNPSFEIYHFHGVRGPELLCMPILKLLGKTTVMKLTLAGSDDPYSLGQRKLLGELYRRCLRTVRTFVSISPSLQSLAEKAGISQEKRRLIANGVDVSKYHLPSENEVTQYRADLGISMEMKVIVSIGAIEHRKGYDSLLSAYEVIRSKRKDVILLIVGPGNDFSNDYYISLRSYIEMHAIEGVRFLGKRNDVEKILMTGDLFAFCSRQEGFGTVLVEAMCCGLSVAVMDIEGITDWIIGDRPAATNCKTRDPSEFAEACISLLETRDLSVARKASIGAHTDFGMNTIAAAYDDLYVDVVVS